MRGYLPAKASTGTTVRFSIYLVILITVVAYLFFALKNYKPKTQSVKSPSSIELEDLELSH